MILFLFFLFLFLFFFFSGYTVGIEFGLRLGVGLGLRIEFGLGLGVGLGLGIGLGIGLGLVLGLDGVAYAGGSWGRIPGPSYVQPACFSSNFFLLKQFSSNINRLMSAFAIGGGKSILMPNVCLLLDPKGGLWAKSTLARDCVGCHECL